MSAALNASAIVEAIIARWSAAFNRLDADALASLYSNSALFYGSVPTLFRGRDGVASYFNGLTRWPSPTVAFTDLVTIAVGQDLVNMAGKATFMTTPDAVPLTVKITWIVVRENSGSKDNNWHIVSHHVSPIAPLIKRD